MKGELTNLDNNTDENTDSWRREIQVYPVVTVVLYTLYSSPDTHTNSNLVSQLAHRGLAAVFILGLLGGNSPLPIPSKSQTPPKFVSDN